MSTQDRVAIFGGTFDPFTIAHREICREAIDKLYIDKLYVIPTVVDYHRQGKDKWLDDSTRITVAKRMLWSLGYKYLDKWKINDHEIRLKRLCEASNASLYNEVIKPRRFIHTLLDFKARHPDSSITLILGSDSVKNLPSWHKWESIFENIDDLVMVQGRDGETISVPEEISRRFPWSKAPDIIDLPSPLEDISATRIRAKYRCNPEYGLFQYVSEVDDFDRGQASLKDLGWASLPSPPPLSSDNNN